jgi:hypothetical protein
LTRHPARGWSSLGLLFWRVINASAGKLILGIRLRIGVVCIFASSFFEFIHGPLDATRAG